METALKNSSLTGGLNEDVLQKLIDLNTQCPVCETVGKD